MDAKMNTATMGENVSLSGFLQKTFLGLLSLFRGAQRGRLQPRISMISDIDIFLAYRKQKGGKDGR